MTPYYRDGFLLFEGDCTEVLQQPDFPLVDCVLTDPPFFMPATHYQSRVKYPRTWSDTSTLKVFWEVVVDRLIARMKPASRLLTFCNHESYSVFFPVLYNRFDHCRSLVWDKERPGLGNIWRHQHELIIHARWKDGYCPPDGTLRADVLRHKATLSADRQHPVEKPVSLLRELLEPVTKPGDIVLDPFAGSGTTLLAAHEIGRRAIGIEADSRYVATITRRLEELESIPRPRVGAFALEVEE